MTTAPTAATAYPLTQDERMLHCMIFHVMDPFIQNVAAKAWCDWTELSSLKHTAEHHMG